MLSGVNLDQTSDGQAQHATLTHVGKATLLG